MDHLTVLAVRAKTGDRHALDDFVMTTMPDVLGVCRYLGRPSDPEDHAQETYTRALGSLHRFRGDGSARAWLLSIARRFCADERRTALVLTLLVGLSYEDAAETIGCPIGTIRSRVARARQQLLGDQTLGFAREA